MLWIIVAILIVLWLFGFFGKNISPKLPHLGNWIHVLIVIALILVLLNVLRVV
jgi:hypothetical protein